VCNVSERAPRRREKASDVLALEAETTADSSTAAVPAQTGSSDGEVATQEPAPDKGRTRRSRRRPARRRGGQSAATERVMLVHGEEAPQIAILEQGVIVEHYIADPQDTSVVGNIYLGRVQNVLPGMEASFIDVGHGRNGVLYASEVGIPGDEGAEVPRIETVLKPGQPILVQVTKDPMRAKGARLTALVSLAGRHLVLVPNTRSLGVSRRLSEAERERLKDAAQRLGLEEHGLIVRTAAEGASEADLRRDLDRLLTSWAGIEKAAHDAAAPALVHQEPELELRVLRDLFNREIVRCVVDDRALESKIGDYIRATSPDLAGRIELYEGELPIFEEFRVLEQIRKSLDRKVWLPSGGHLVIERTEAMTVIDVNTGKFVGKSHLEETVFRTNKEAAVEVVRQLRLRDIGGIIVVDFIDMDDDTNRAELERVFAAELDRDRTRTQVFPISALGLIQMTRKNVSAGIVEAFSDPCPTCDGRGIVVHDVD